MAEDIQQIILVLVVVAVVVERMKIILLVAVQVLAEVDESRPLLPGEMFTEFSQFNLLTNFVLSFIISM